MKAKDIMEIYEISRVTLCSWVKSGKILVDILPSGRYDYHTIDNSKNAEHKAIRKVVIYSRVSSSTQKADLSRQMERLQNFCISCGIVVTDSYSEIASALNYQRRQYRRLYKEITENKVDTVVIEHKDRLLRIGFDDFLELCNTYDTKVVIANESEDTSKAKEITDDLISVIHHFSAKIYSSRRVRKLTTIMEKAMEEHEDA